MKWENILEAIFAFPSLLLDQLVESLRKIALEERQLAQNGEFDDEDLEE